MAQRFTVPNANGTYDFPMTHGAFGMHECVLSFGPSAPTAGTISVQYKRLGGHSFTPISHATNLAATAAYFRFRIDEPLGTLRVIVAGLTAADPGLLIIESVVLPASVFNGVAAIVTQPYVEANVKNGVQFYARAAWPLADPILAGTTRKMFIQTGTKNIIVKLRGLDDLSEELELRLFASPTGVSGGTDLTIHNYNLMNPAVTTILQAKKNVTTTTDGTEIDGGDPEYFFGAAATGQRNKSQTPPGIERIVPASSTFLISITNTGTGSARAQYYLTWYEGDPDVPI